MESVKGGITNSVRVYDKWSGFKVVKKRLHCAGEHFHAEDDEKEDFDNAGRGGHFSHVVAPDFGPRGQSSVPRRVSPASLSEGEDFVDQEGTRANRNVNLCLRTIKENAESMKEDIRRVLEKVSGIREEEDRLPVFYLAVVLWAAIARMHMRASIFVLLMKGIPALSWGDHVQMLVTLLSNSVVTLTAELSKDAWSGLLRNMSAQMTQPFVEADLVPLGTLELQVMNLLILADQIVDLISQIWVLKDDRRLGFLDETYE